MNRIVLTLLGLLLLLALFRGADSDRPTPVSPLGVPDASAPSVPEHGPSIAGEDGFEISPGTHELPVEDGVELACLSNHRSNTCFAPGDDYGPALEKALSRFHANELLGAIELAEAIWECKRVPRTERELARQMLQGWARNESLAAFPESELSETLNATYGGNASKAEVSLIHVRRLEICAPVFALLDGGFRERLDSLAESGNEAAQLLFTLLGPPEDASFEGRVDWQLVSGSYLERAAQRRHPMGLIAHSFAYMGIAKPFHFVLAWSYARAAMACGIDQRLVPSVFRDIDPDEPTSRYTQGLFAQEARERWTERLLALCPSGR